MVFYRRWSWRRRRRCRMRFRKTRVHNDSAYPIVVYRGFRPPATATTATARFIAPSVTTIITTTAMIIIINVIVMSTATATTVTLIITRGSLIIFANERGCDVLSRARAADPGRCHGIMTLPPVTFTPPPQPLTGKNILVHWCRG